MIEYGQLNNQEQDKVRSQAMSWYRQHYNHVMSLINKEPAKIAPSGSDMFHPELWKGIHWRWFLDNSFLL